MGTPSPSTAPNSRAPERCEQINYQGKRYGVGTLAGGDGYGVWDLSSGGLPVSTYPPGEEGWNMAWTEYRQAERTAGSRDKSRLRWLLWGGLAILILALFTAYVLIHLFRYAHCGVAPSIFSWPSEC